MNEMYLIVKKYIDEYDFDSLLETGAPPDKYDLESKRISALIATESSAEEIASVIASVMKSSFGSLEKADVDKSESFIEIAKKIKRDL